MTTESEPPASPSTHRAHAAGLHAVRIWDLPTRLFHWTLAASVLGALVTGSLGESARQWHLRFGQFLLALVAFRLMWGIVGGRWSRFAHFQWAPRGKADAGHAFPGSWAVLGLLGVLGTQIATGLLADDEIATLGPLALLAPEPWVRAATAWHKGWGEVSVWGIVGLHLCAIAWYVARGRSLVEPMVGGDRHLAQPVPSSRDDAATRRWAALLFVLCLLAAAGVFRLGMQAA